MKLFLNSFHIDYYQAHGKSMFVSPLYDSPGSWSKSPPVPATAYHKASRSSTLSSVQFPWTALLSQNYTKFLVWPCISLCSGDTAIFNNRNVQWSNKPLSSHCVLTDLPPGWHAGDTHVWWFTLIFHCLQQKWHILSKDLYFWHLWPKGDFQKTGRDWWIHYPCWSVWNCWEADSLRMIICGSAVTAGLNLV